VVRQFLTAHNIAFEEVDIERSPEALQKLVELTGSATHVPVLTVDGEVFIDFNQEMASMILELANQPPR
jgi:glutaredoxin